MNILYYVDDIIILREIKKKK